MRPVGSSMGDGERSSGIQSMKELSTCLYLHSQVSCYKHSSSRQRRESLLVVKLWGVIRTRALKGLVKGFGRCPVFPLAKCTRPLVWPRHMPQVSMECCPKDRNSISSGNSRIILEFRSSLIPEAKTKACGAGKLNVWLGAVARVCTSA